MDIAINTEAKKMNLEKEENAVLGNRLKRLVKNRHFKKIFFNTVKLFTFNFLFLFFSPLYTHQTAYTNHCRAPVHVTDTPCPIPGRDIIPYIGRKHHSMRLWLCFISGCKPSDSWPVPAGQSVFLSFHGS